MVDQYKVFRKPAGISLEDAAASLSVYVTAYYSLIHLARLRKGQRVLIHSAMGGVGQAAIALAKHVGADIYATAGSEGKRDRLREMGVLGAFDSHSHDWYDDLMEATGGEGVDVVLNSLAGRHIELCLEALRPSGWHCEIGKVDIYADNALSLRVFRKTSASPRSTSTACCWTIRSCPTSCPGPASISWTRARCRRFRSPPSRTPTTTRRCAS